MVARRASRPLARHARRWAVVGVSVLALAASTLPAAADPSNPTQEELSAADRRVEAERERLHALTQRAEIATEAYNGARVVAERATATSTAAAAAAGRAERAYAAAKATATTAQQKAQQAKDAADAAAVRQLSAEAEADAAQQQLDEIAVSAYRSQGQLAMVSALMQAGDPTQLVQMRDSISRVGSYQDHVIEVAAEARSRAKAAANAATEALSAAADAAEQAEAALERAETTRTAATAAHAQAASSAAAAVKASRAARTARNTAMSLVAQAEAILRRAVKSQKSLQQAAAEARAEAKGYRGGPAPSEAARIAIHHAFEQIGVPYSWGGGDENGPTYGFAQGAGTKGFDCSGLTLYAYHQGGVRLDHYSRSQWNVGTRIKRRSELKPGDLMFFAYDTRDESTIHHVSIYIGDGKMIEAPYTGEVVRVTSASRSDFIGGTRPWA
jgi:peptidoglycan DL-endopeptidase RipA